MAESPPGYSPMPPDAPVDPPRYTPMPPDAPVDPPPLAPAYPGFLPTEQQGTMNAAQGWLQQMSAAQQGTSPVVRDAQGNLNYNRLGNPIDTDAGPGYIDSDGKWQIVDPTRHVTLTDPATGNATVFERRQEMEMGRAESLGHLTPFGVLSGVPAVPAALSGTGGSTAAKVLGSPLVKGGANLATAYGTTKVGELLHLPESLSDLIALNLGFGPHASGGGIGAQTMQKLANWFSKRAPPSVPPTSAVVSPIPVPGLLSNTTQVLTRGAEGSVGYPYPYSTP